MKRENKIIVIWLLSGCLLIFLMVVVGGLTRLTHSGLSMVEWNITGSFPPTSHREWNLLFENYKKSPEYMLVNSYFTIEDFKNIFWFEYIHRLIGRLIGIVFIVPFLYFLIKKKIPKGYLKKMIFLLFLGGVQGLIGWYMVKSGLVKNPAVSHYRLAFHLITAFITFGFTFWFALDLTFQNKNITKSISLKRYVIAFFVILILQIIYGALVAGLKAGYVYTTYPKMGSEWFPTIITSQKPIWLNFLEMHAGVQFVHRCIALLLLILSIIIYYKARKSKIATQLKKSLNLIPITVLLQFMLGVFTLIYSVPLSVAILHQTMAFILFSVTLYNLHNIEKS